MARGRVDGHARPSRPEGCRPADTGPAEAKAVGTEVVDDVVDWSTADISRGVHLVGTGQVPELQELVASRRVGFEPCHPDGRLDFKAFSGLATGAEAPTRTVVLALVFAVEDKDIDLRSVGDVELDLPEATDEVGTKVPDERCRVVRLAHLVDLSGLETPWSVLDAAARIELGIEASELVAGGRPEVEPVLLPFRPRRETAAVVVGEAGDLELAVGLRLGATETSLLVPVGQPDRVCTERIDLGHRDFETLAVGAYAPELVALVVRGNGDTGTTAVGRKHERTGKSRGTAQVRTGVALVVIDVTMIDETGADHVERVDTLVVEPHPDVHPAARGVVPEVVGVPQKRGTTSRDGGAEDGREVLLDPSKDVTRGEHGRRSSVQSQSSRGRNESLLEHGALLGLCP